MKDSGIFEELFDNVVMQAVNAGYIDGEVLFSGCSHLKANANKRRLAKPTTKGATPEMIAEAREKHLAARQAERELCDTAEDDILAAVQLSGLDWAREALLKAGFTTEEAEQIGQAVAKHTEKESVGSTLEELVKDTDVLKVYPAGAVCPPSFQGRLERLKAELGIREVTISAGGVPEAGLPALGTPFFVGQVQIRFQATSTMPPAASPRTRRDSRQEPTWDMPVRPSPTLVPGHLD